MFFTYVKNNCQYHEREHKPLEFVSDMTDIGLNIGKKIIKKYMDFLILIKK
ncbi:MAG: hypothetical protein A4E35_01406 [Methanoregula sp. PtaU1.Bin051]|nr:MAG: hypothetical protein A4E35_01406 [Methanoregula sp. PtaU1.Bin051]